MKKALKIFLLLCYILICGEVIIRVSSSFISIYDVEMLKYAVKLKRRSENPKLTHKHIPNSSVKLMGVNVSLNSLGQRSPELAIPKPADEKRIYVLGSSIALGWGVPVEQTFPCLVEEKLNARKISPNNGYYRVINAGMGNTNTFAQVELFKAQVDKTEPDFAILQFFINDAELQQKRSDYWFLKNSYFLAYVYQSAKVLSFRFYGPPSLGDYYASFYNGTHAGWNEAKASLGELKAICNERSIPLFVLLVPDLHNLSAESVFPGLYNQIMLTFQQIEIPAVSAYPDVARKFAGNERASWVARDDAHPNAEVHRIMAGNLYDLLVQEGL